LRRGERRFAFGPLFAGRINPLVDLPDDDAWRRAAANPSFGNLPSAGRTRRPSGNRARTVQV
jgi:hypothetical protein